MEVKEITEYVHGPILYKEVTASVNKTLKIGEVVSEHFIIPKDLDISTIEEIDKPLPPEPEPIAPINDFRTEGANIQKTKLKTYLPEECYEFLMDMLKKDQAVYDAYAECAVINTKEPLYLSIEQQITELFAEYNITTDEVIANCAFTPVL